MLFVWRMRSAKFQSLTRPSFGDSRTQLAFLGKVFYSQANVAGSEIGGYSSLKVVESFPNPPNDKEKPAAPLPASLSPSLLDSKQLKAISRVSEISPAGKLRPEVLYLIELGMDLKSGSEIGGYSSLKVVESFPNPPNDKEKPAAPLPASLSPSLLDSKQLKAISRVSEISPAGKLRPEVLYLIELGMDLKSGSEIGGYSSLKVVESFPNPPNDKEKPAAPLPASLSPSLLDSKQLKAISRVSEISPAGKLRPEVLYLIELGMDLKSGSEIGGYSSLKVVESFPNPPNDKEKPAAPLPASLSPSLLDSKQLKAISRVSEISPAGKLRPEVLYLIELGMDLKSGSEIGGYSSLKVVESFPNPPNDKEKPAAPLPASLSPSLLDSKQLKAISRVSEISPAGKLRPEVLYLIELGMDLKSGSEIGGYSSLKVVESFPNPPNDKEKPAAPLPASLSPSLLDSKQLKAISRVSEISPAGKLRPEVLYLIELGMDLDQIKSITRSHAAFAFYNLERELKPLVDFLVDLGVQKSDIPSILNKKPQLCGLSLSENIIPTMAFLEGLGVDKKRWAKLIYWYPDILGHSRQKVKTIVDFLYEVGLSAQSIGKVLTRHPHIIGDSVEDKLRPIVEYFRSLGVDVAVLLCQAPQICGLSIDTDLKPVTEFFLENGYSMEEVGTMISRYRPLYTKSLAKNLIPKWEFFLTMDYPRSYLVKFPQYFCFSLEERIKPRYAHMKERGVVLPLYTLLFTSSDDFEMALKSKLKRKTC